jgi:ABC-type glutathione transport system ATPase component
MSHWEISPRRGRSDLAEPVLVADISVDYPKRPEVLNRVSVDIYPGETLGLIGESGSGKSTLALALMRLLSHTGAIVRGRISLAGFDLTHFDERQMRDIRGRLISLVPQNPASALNPALRLGAQLREAWHAHSRAPWSGQEERMQNLLRSVGLPFDRTFLGRFPGETSVGQAQRVLILMALLHAPRLLIADEPTSALDSITQREVIDLLARVTREHQISMLLISHDLITISTICDRLAILYGGTIVECRSTRDILSSPSHPHTKRLIAASIPERV